MNISAITMKSVASAKAPVSSAVNPAVRRVADSKKAFSTRCSPGRAPRVAGFPHSVNAMATDPKTSNASVVRQDELRLERHALEPAAGDRVPDDREAEAAEGRAGGRG